MAIHNPPPPKQPGYVAPFKYHQAESFKGREPANEDGLHKTFSNGVETMKLIQSLIVAAAVALPVLSFAQSNQPVTRAEVRAQLVELENAGYNPAGDQTQYPQNIQAAQARVDAAKGNTAYGSPAGGTTASGARSVNSNIPGFGDIYAHP
jgi:hypothetical protein